MTPSPLRRGLPLAAAAVLSLLTLAAGPVRADADLWAPLGPSGGSVTAVAVDPQDDNTVYAGGHQGGVSRSRNGGRSWEPVGLDGGVSLLAVAPATRAVYAITGNGLFRSSDFGASWVSLSEALRAVAGTPFALSLALPPSPGAVFAVVPRGATGNQEILRSTDGGDTWQAVLVPPSAVFLVRVYADPTDARFLFAATTGGVYTSADGGATWSAGSLTRAVLRIGIENGPRHRLLAAVRNPAPQGFPDDHLWVSSDRGRTWSPRDTLPGRPLGELLGDPTTPGGFDALTQTGDLFRTTDAGLHWTDLGFVPASGASASLALALDPVRPGVAFLGTYGDRSGLGLWKTATFGAGWTPFVRGLYASDFLAVTPAPGAPDTLWAGAGSLAAGLGSPFGLWKSADRGRTWAQVAFADRFVPAVLAAGAPHRLFAVVAGQRLQRSDDDGLHWVATALGSGEGEAFASPSGEPATVYGLGTRGLAVSLDGGLHWTIRPIPGNAPSTLAAGSGSPAAVYINASGRVLGPSNPDTLRRSTDRGLTWTSLLQVSGGYLSSVGTDPADPRRIVVSAEYLDAASQPATSLLWSADGGITWKSGNLSPHPSRVFTLLPDPLVPHGFLAGTGEGAFESADGGATWTRLGEGLPRTATHLSLDPASPTTVYAATEGGGIYRLQRTNP